MEEEKVTLRSPVRWIGGKGKHAHKILPWFPRHRCYVEPFGGGASVLLSKPRSEVEVYNDIDRNVTNLFRSLQQNGEQVFEKIALTPYSRKEQQNSRRQLSLSHRCIVAYRQSFGGNIAAYGFDTKAGPGEIAPTVAGYLRSINKLNLISLRLRDVVFHSEDALRVIGKYDAPDTLFYLDPPYVTSTWKVENGLYTSVMTDEEHIKLLQLLKIVKGMVVLSGYENPLYAKLLLWKKHSFNTTSSLAARTTITGLKGTNSIKEKQPRTECLWLNDSVVRRLRDEHRW